MKIKYFLYLVPAVALVVLVTDLHTLNAISEKSSGVVHGQYIVVFRDTVGDADGAADDLVARHGLEHLFTYSHALKGFAAVITDSELDAIRQDPRVAFVSEDHAVSAFGVVTEKKGPPSPPPPPSPSQVIPTGVSRIGAVGLANKGAGVNVAVIDTGIDTSHPDLAANTAGGVNCSTGRSYQDGNGHGTHVAGTIAALDNSIGVVGVAPQAKIWAVRVLNNNGSGTWSSVICGVDFVTAHADVIKVANMSLGGSGTSDNNCGNTNGDALHKAICRSRDAGVTYVVAAGNGDASGNPVDASTEVPAAYNDAVITVSALADSDGAPGGTGAATSYGADDTFASFSNYGSVVDIGAPGVSILSTWPGGGYATLSGTSMATPHVTGAAALYVAAHPGALWTTVRDALVVSGEALGAGHTDPSGLHPEPVLKTATL